MLNSKSNEQVKFLASLKNKKYRDKYLKYIIEGIKLIGEMMDSEGFGPSEFIVYSEELLMKNHGGAEILHRLNNEINTVEVSKGIFEYISGTETPQGILAVKNIPSYTKQEKLNEILNLIKQNKNFLILDGVSDTGNLGTIIRCAVTFEIDCILCIKKTADIYNPKVVRSTMGAIQKLKTFYLEEEEYIEIIELLRNYNYEVVSTDLSAKKYLDKLDYTKNVVFVLGNEANGISQITRELCTDCIKIPISDAQESLNVAVAAGICLYERYININGISKGHT